MKWKVIILIVGVGLLSLLTSNQNNKITKKIYPENPNGRTNYWKERRGDIDHKYYESVKRKYRKELKKTTSKYRDGGIMQWEELGPNNIGGRIRAIAIHPSDEDIILVGAAAGGLWKSTDEGMTWNLKTPYLSSYPVSSIAYDPFDNEIVYATTGEFYGGGPNQPGVGVIKSTDGGETWNELPIPGGWSTTWFSKVVMNPLMQNSLFVGGSSTGGIGSVSGGIVYRSNDGGLTWTNLLLSTSTGANISDIAIDPQDTSHIVIGTNTTALESFSSGQGGSWSSIVGGGTLIPSLSNGELGGRCEIEITSANNISYLSVSRYVANPFVNNQAIDLHRSEVWQSVSGANNFNALVYLQDTVQNNANLPFGNQGQYDQALWVDPNDQTRFIIGGFDLWKYDSGVLTRISEWQSDIDGSNSQGNDNSIHADQHVIVPSSSYNGNNNNKVWIGNDGGIYGSNNIWTATQNSGWYARNDGLAITQLYGADLAYNGNTAVGGAQDNSYFYNNDANASLNFTQPTTGDGGICRVHKTNNNILYTSTQRGSVYKSTDGGISFCPILYIDADSIAVLNNSCGGLTSLYTQPTVQFIVPIELSNIDSDKIYVGGANLFGSEDAGESWDYLNLAYPLLGENITAIDIYDQNDDIIVVGTNKGTFDITFDNGNNWSTLASNLDGTPALLPITDVIFNSNDSSRILVSLGGIGNPQNAPLANHLYLTTNGGTTWSNVSLNIDIHAESVAWHPTESNWIYVGTEVGIFASEDLGQTWNVTPLIFDGSDGPVTTLITELFWQGDGSDSTPYYLCAATHGRGLWRSKFPVRKEHYVDKNCTSCGTGSFDKPYKFFRNAVAAAGSGSTIIFKTGGTYDEVPSSIFTNQRIKIEFLDATVAPVLIK